MPTIFDESCLLDPLYSAEASGGPEFASAIVRSGQGGAMANRNANREDYVSRYEIDYMELDSVRRKALRQFAILRNGMTRGFRFLAPDDHELEAERVGWLNPATGEVEWIEQTDGVITDYYLIRHYSDVCNSYTKRIVKPSPFEEVKIEVFSFGGGLAGSTTIPANTAVIDKVIEPVVTGFELDPGYPFTFNFQTGVLHFPIAPYPPDNVIKVSCVYHLPVAFSEDWHKFSVDEVGISSFKVGVEEILPAELNIV